MTSLSWLRRLLATEPLRRSRAEASISALYVAAQMVPPSVLAWFDSRSDAEREQIATTPGAVTAAAGGPRGQHGATESFVPDLLVVYGADDALAECEQMDDEIDAITITPDDVHQADTTGGDAYEIAVPDAAADGRLLNERHDLYFVGYLRLCFEYGRFPGYEGIKNAALPGRRVAG